MERVSVELRDREACFGVARPLVAAVAVGLFAFGEQALEELDRFARSSQLLLGGRGAEKRVVPEAPSR